MQISPSLPLGLALSFFVAPVPINHAKYIDIGKTWSVKGLMAERDGKWDLAHI